MAAPEKLAPIMSDRHTGVGGDGIILVAPPTAAAMAQGATVRMRMFNADGSESEMCGNGVRCVAKFRVRPQPVAPESDEGGDRPGRARTRAARRGRQG